MAAFIQILTNGGAFNPTAARLQQSIYAGANAYDVYISLNLFNHVKWIILNLS